MPVPFDPSVSEWLEGDCWRRSAPGWQEAIFPWDPKAGARRLSPGRGWRPFSPVLRVGELEGRGGEPGPGLLVRLVPAAVRDAIRPFPEPQWELLMLANQGGEPGLDLIRTNPALAYLAAHARCFLPVQALRSGVPAAGRLARMRRPELAGLFGLPASQAGVNLLRKVRVAFCTDASLRGLRNGLWDCAPAAVRRLSHLPALHPWLAMAAADQEIGRRLAARDWAQFALAAPEDARRRWEELKAAARPRPRPCPVIPATAHRTFPDPPLPGTRWIQPIRTAAGLEAESAEMHHCARTYRSRVERGTAYFYRILQPERATLCLRPHRGCWFIEELRGRHNATPGAAVRGRIQQWLREEFAPQPSLFGERQLRLGFDELPPLSIS